MRKDKREEYFKKYREKNKDKIKGQLKEYREKNRDKRKGYFKEYHKNNKVREKEYRIKYREQHRDKLREYEKTYWKKNEGRKKERHKEYYEKNKEWFFDAAYKRRAKTKQTDITTKYRVDLKTNTTHCEICGKKFKTDDKKHLDHIIPLNIGGTHTRNNVRYVHAKCNLQRPKNGSDIIQFRLL